MVRYLRQRTRQAGSQSLDETVRARFDWLILALDDCEGLQTACTYEEYLRVFFALVRWQPTENLNHLVVSFFPLISTPRADFDAFPRNL